MGSVSDRAPASDAHSLVFIGGLHRSGTSPLFQLLREHPKASGFRATGAKEDEGQHLQTVYRPANAYGGEGRFGFHADAHLVELPPAAAPRPAETLFGQWSRHWDLERPVLVEKSPPNLIRMRFLQSLFPQARFVVIIRHPVEVVLGQRRRARRQSLASLFRHWFVCHDTFLDDAPFVRALLVVRYEELLRDPAATFDRVLGFVGLDRASEVPLDMVSSAASDRYQAQWERFCTRRRSRPYARMLVRRFEQRARAYGYSLGPPAATLPWSMPEVAPVGPRT